MEHVVHQDLLALQETREPLAVMGNQVEDLVVNIFRLKFYSNYTS